MNTIIFVLAILVTLLYLRYILVILFLPTMYLKALSTRVGNKRFAKLLYLQYRVFQKLTRDGIERLCIYTMSTIPSCSLRKLYYKLIGVRMGKKVVFHFKTEIRAPWNLVIGNGTIIGDNAILDARSKLNIGCNVNISSNASIYSLQHNHRSPFFDCKFDRNLTVRIHDRVWLGCNVVILPGVTIGEGAVVCAGAVVTKDIPPYTVVAGIPAQKVGERPHNLSYEFPGKTCWFY